MMDRNILLLICFLGISVMVVNAASVDKDGTEEQPRSIKFAESLKEFVRIVEKYNLNVSMIGSHKEYDSDGNTKESISITWHMPRTTGNWTEPILDDSKQKQYLEKMEKLATKEHTGARTRVIPIENGVSVEGTEATLNPDYIIDSKGYEYLTNYTNGVSGFQIPKNQTSQILYNYLIAKPGSDGVANVQIVTGNVLIEDKDISEDFSPEVLAEIKSMLPKLYLSIDDDNLLARLIGERLDKKFKANYQILIGVDEVALGKRPYAKLTVGGTNVLIFK